MWIVMQKIYMQCINNMRISLQIILECAIINHVNQPGAKSSLINSTMSCLALLSAWCTTMLELSTRRCSRRQALSGIQHKIPSSVCILSLLTEISVCKYWYLYTWISIIFTMMIYILPWYFTKNIS